MMMDKKAKTPNALLHSVLAPLLIAAVLLCFFSGLSNLSQGHSDEGKQQLEDALHRAAVACYAVEGFYPPDLNYLTEHYGIQIDHSRFAVSYTVFAENLMPDITVLEK